MIWHILTLIWHHCNQFSLIEATAFYCHFITHVIPPLPTLHNLRDPTNQFIAYLSMLYCNHQHDDVVKWKHFRVTGPTCGEFTGDRWIPLTKASDAELWCCPWSAPWISGWVNNREAGDLRRHRAHYDVIVLLTDFWGIFQLKIPFTRKCLVAMKLPSYHVISAIGLSMLTMLF